MFQHSFILPTDEDMPIWRYMSFSKFLSLLSMSSLFFSRADKFVDKFEGHVNAHTHNLIQHLFDEFDDSVSMSKQLESLLTNMKKCTYVSCWHMNYNESQDMWDEYSLNGEGIAIKSISKRLMVSVLNNDLGPMHLRPIRYADKIDEEIDLSNALDLMNYKQPHFAFENELRLLLIYTKGAFDKLSDEEMSEIVIPTPEFGVSVQINLDALIETIYVSPNSPKWFYELVKNLVSITLKKDVLESSLK